MRCIQCNGSMVQNRAELGTWYVSHEFSDNTRGKFCRAGMAVLYLHVGLQIIVTMTQNVYLQNADLFVYAETE